MRHKAAGGDRRDQPGETMAAQTVCAIELRTERREDGRFHVWSPDVPGLHLVGSDAEAIRVDLEPALKDLLKGNFQFDVAGVHLVPNLATVVRRYESGVQRETYLATLKRAG